LEEVKVFGIKAVGSESANSYSLSEARSKKGNNGRLALGEFEVLKELR
jgi:hypothetical protein